MTAMRVRLAQRPPVSISRIVCDAPGCVSNAESRYGASEARGLAREAGWAVSVRTPTLHRPADYCPQHAELAR